MIGLPRTKKVQANDEKEPAEYTKEQILASKKYRDSRDLLNALLADKKRYTLEAVEKMMNEFKKGKVK